MLKRCGAVLVFLMTVLAVQLPTAAAAGLPGLSGPGVAPRSSVVTIAGHAASGARVQVWFHRAGESAGRFTLRRQLTADASGRFRTSYRADTDYRYYAVVDGQRSAAVLTRVASTTISGPAQAILNSTVVLQGSSAPPRALVDVYFHRAGQPAADYTRRRHIRADAAGHWSSTFRADADYRYYAESGGYRSPSALTRAVATPKPVYYFPVSPVSAAGYAHVHHDYPATDVFEPCGSNMVAVTSGTVQEVSRVDRWNPATDNPAVRGGLFVSLIGDDGVRYYMAHLHDLLPGIAPGVRVRAGQVLAHVGQTGNAVGLGCHVHFGMSPPCGPGEWSIRRGVFFPWPFLDSWRSGGQLSPVAQKNAWLARHRAECAAHRLAGT